MLTETHFQAPYTVIYRSLCSSHRQVYRVTVMIACADVFFFLSFSLLSHAYTFR